VPWHHAGTKKEGLILQPGLLSCAETLWQAVMAMGQPSLAGFSVEVLPEIDSTNTELMRRARAGLTEPILLVAEQQTAGRGRLGRNWASAPGDSLTFSLGVLLQPEAWDGLSLAVGLSVATSLHEAIQLKWPNDLWVQGCKLAGILIETAAVTGHAGPRYAVIGVGINIAPRPSEGLSTPPAHLRALLPHASAAQALQSVAAPLLRDLLQFERDGFAPFAPRFAALDALQGRQVQLSDGMQGTAQGVDGRGALLVQTAQGLQHISSSEVSVRPVPASWTATA
jgi:BirA family transcriptional regulator, biotin operon repressor / biotin---[acetyl-CoA-carboxylase] ligase